LRPPGCRQQMPSTSLTNSLTCAFSRVLNWCMSPRYDRFPAGPIEPSHAERMADAPKPRVSAVIVDKLGDYIDWAKRNPDIDAVPYAVGKPLPNIHFDHIIFARDIHPIIEWAVVDLGSRIAPENGKVTFEQWPEST